MYWLVLLSKLPLSVLYALSSVMAFLLFHLFRYRRTTSLTNIEKSFPDKTREEIVIIQKASYVYMTDCFVESIKAYQIKKDDIIQRVRMLEYEDIKNTLKQGQSALILVAHSGCGEWLSQAGTFYFEANIDPVYKPAHSKWLDRFIFATRSRPSNTPIPYKQLAKDIQRRKKVVRCIAMLADLSPRRREQTITVDFLHQPTRFFQSAERIAKLANVPVYFAKTHRLKRGYYEITMQKICESPKSIQDNELTELYAKKVEQMIIAQPEAWLWTHRRWKHPAKPNQYN